MTDATSVEMLLAAKETIAAVEAESAGPLRGDFPGAVGGVGYAPDPWSLFVECRRNLNAYAQWKHGEAAFLRMLEADGA